MLLLSCENGIFGDTKREGEMGIGTQGGGGTQKYPSGCNAGIWRGILIGAKNGILFCIKCIMLFTFWLRHTHRLLQTKIDVNVRIK